MDWNRLRVFKAVAEAGSFTGAMRMVNLSQSAISRNISGLEESLGSKLFHRHARGLLLTENGETLLTTVHDVFHQLSMVEARLSENNEIPAGSLSVTATVAFGTTWLVDQIHDFLNEFPDIKINLVLADHELDLGMRQADVAIRMGTPHHHDLIQRRLINFRMKIYASNEFIAQYGMPKTPEELDDFHLILFNEKEHSPLENVNWLAKIGRSNKPSRKPRLTVNSLYAMYRAVRANLGIASLPDYMALDPQSLNLQQILPEIEGPSTMSYFVYPEELRHSKRIAAFRDFFLKRVETLK